MAKGKVYHWKHGWIPLDRAAFDNKMGKGPKPTGKSKGGSLTKDQRQRIVKMIRRQNDKPKNWVPAADNKPKWKPPTRAESKKIIADELADATAKREASDKVLLGKDYRSMSPAEKIRAAEIMYGKDSRQAKAARAALESRVEKSAAEMRRERYRSLTTVDGVDFVTYKSSAMDPLGDDHGRPYQFTPDQMQTLADAYNEVKAEFPGMKPVQIVGVDGKTGAFGITSWDGRRISMSSDAFNDERREFAAKEWGDHGAIAGQFTDDPEGFARAVMTHELGHALQMQNETALRRGQQLALEKVTLDDPNNVAEPVESVWDGPQRYHRWEVDTLKGQSAYATGNKFEWFAEAFADGWFNGDKATPQGKRALAILTEAYGGAKLGRIPIPAPGKLVQKGVVA